MFALTLLTAANRLHHDVMVPAWYWAAAVVDGAAYMATAMLPRR